MKLKVLFFSVILSLGLSSCATTNDKAADKSNSSVNMAIASAEKARKAVAKVGYEWRDTGKIITSAKKLAAKGKDKEATALAQKAKDQADAALAQYNTESARYAELHK